MPHRLSLRTNGKHRKQRSGDYSVTINGLMTRRSLLLSESPSALTKDLATIDSALKLCGFQEDPQQYMPKCRKRSIFKKGEKRRLVMEVLRNADRPLSSREICLDILAGKKFDVTDTRRLNQTVTGVYNVLVAEGENGQLDRVEGFPVRWILRS